MRSATVDTIGPATLDAVLADLERRAREYEHDAQSCREATSLLRRLYGRSTLAPPAAIRPAAAAATVTSSVTPAPPPGPRAVPPPADARVLDFLKQQTEPITLGTIRTALKIGTIQLRLVLERLGNAGQAVKRGTRCYMRVGTPQIMAAHPPPAPKVAPRPSRVATPRQVAVGKPLEDRAPGRTGETLREWLLRVPFASPGDPEPMADLFTALPASLSPTSFETMRDQLGDLMREGLIELVKVGGERRYQRCTSVAPVRIDEAALLEALDRLLATGASYDVPDLLRRLRPTVPLLNQTALEDLLVRLRQATLIDRIAAIDGAVRWRRIGTKSVAKFTRAEAVS